MTQPTPQDAPAPADAVGQPGPYAQPGPYTQDAAAYPPGPPRRGATGRVLMTVGMVVAGAAVAFGALYLVDMMMFEGNTTTETYDAVDSVELVADGDVTVSAADGDIEVDVIAESGLWAPVYRADESANRLELTHRCWSVALPTCSGALDVTLPAGTEVVVRTENGDVVASGLVGELSLDSSNGWITASDLGGPLVARTSNGDIDVTDSRADVEATSSNGDVSVFGVDGSVTTDSSNGRIVVDDVTGDASATTSNGSVEVSAVAGNIDGESSNGDVTVISDGRPAALTLSTSNGDEISEGPVDPDAERTVDIRSSNGDVAYLGE